VELFSPLEWSSLLDDILLDLVVEEIVSCEAIEMTWSEQFVAENMKAKPI
jgi:hypothetical protein